MKTILFDPKTGMLDAVENGTKTQTSRKLSDLTKKVANLINPDLFEGDVNLPELGDVKAVRFAEEYNLWQIKCLKDSRSGHATFWLGDPPGMEEFGFEYDNIPFGSWKTLRSHKIGDVLAVAEPFWKDDEQNYYLESELDIKQIQIEGGFEYQGKIKDDKSNVYGRIFKCNRQGFPADLAETFIKIKSVAIKKPCDFTDEEYLAEGIPHPILIEGASVMWNYKTKNDMWFWKDYSDDTFSKMYIHDSFESLLQSIHGKKKGRAIFNAECLVYTFELCDREGNTL